MIRSRLRDYILLSLVTVGLFGCGSDDSNTSNAGSVILTSEADWVAFQDGPGGVWRVVTPDGGSGTTYTLVVSDADGRYGIATQLFSTTINAEFIKIIQATRNDATTLSLGMDDTRGTIDATISNFAGNSGIVSTAGYGVLVTTNKTYNLTAYKGTQDAIATEKDAFSVFLSGVSSRDLSVLTTVATALDFDSNDLSKNTTQTFTVTGGTGSVALYTANGASAPVSESGSDYAYLNGTISSDMYFFQAMTTGKTLSEYYSASSNPGDRTANPTLMNTLSGVAMNYSGLSGLSYTASASSPPMFGYRVYANQNRTPQNVSYYMFISSNWLGTDTTYSRPSFSGLPGYNTDWDFAGGNSVSAAAYAYMLSGASTFNFDGNTQAVAGTVKHVAGSSVNFTP